MWAYKENFDVRIVRPYEATRLLRYEGKLDAHDIEPGLEIDRWISKVRMMTQNVAMSMGCRADVEETPVLAKQSRVPDYSRRKALNRADLVIFADPDDLVFEYLEKEPLPNNPMFSVIIGTLRRDLDQIRALADQLPKTPLLEFENDGTMKEVSRIEVISMREERTLPGVIRRSLCA